MERDHSGPSHTDQLVPYASDRNGSLIAHNAVHFIDLGCELCLLFVWSQGVGPVQGTVSAPVTTAWDVRLQLSVTLLGVSANEANASMYFAGRSRYSKCIACARNNNLLPPEEKK